jgi:hypothetical protein
MNYDREEREIDFFCKKIKIKIKWAAKYTATLTTFLNFNFLKKSQTK